MFSNSPPLGYNRPVALRFFRKSAAETPPEETTSGPPSAAPPEDAPTPAPRTRRAGARSSRSRSATNTSRSSSGRASRSRGGAERKPAAPREEAQVVPLRAEPATLAQLLARQEAVLEQLAERQVEALKGFQGSLSAIENRLANIERLEGVEQPRVGIFVDVPNVMYAAERLRVAIDFGKLLKFLVRGRQMVRASAYAPISDDPAAPLETQRFVQPFVGLGYRIVTKPLKRYADGSMKANFDVELAIDVLSMSDRLDVVTLVSGDGDFRRLVDLVASKGVRVEVVAFGQSTAAELRAVADEYIDISDYLAELRVR